MCGMSSGSGSDTGIGTGASRGITGDMSFSSLVDAVAVLEGERDRAESWGIIAFKRSFLGGRKFGEGGALDMLSEWKDQSSY